MNLTICYRLVLCTPSLINSFTHELFTISFSPSFIHLLLRPFISPPNQPFTDTRANSSATHSLSSLFIHLLLHALFTYSLTHASGGYHRRIHTPTFGRLSSISILAGSILYCSLTQAKFILAGSILYCSLTQAQFILAGSILYCRLTQTQFILAGSILHCSLTQAQFILAGYILYCSLTQAQFILAGSILYCSLTQAQFILAGSILYCSLTQAQFILAGSILYCSLTQAQFILPAGNFVSQSTKLIIHYFPSTYFISVNKYEFQYCSKKLLEIYIESEQGNVSPYKTSSDLSLAIKQKKKKYN